MKYNRYTNHSPFVSEIGFGAWQLGINSGWKGMSEKEAIEMVQASIDYGVNFFDTAPNYGLGTSEIRLGKALTNYDRTKLVINTKFGHTDSGELNFSSEYIRDSIDGSLRRLQTDYLDSVIIHNPPLEYLDGRKNSHYDILEQLKREGKIKAYGASLDTFDEMMLFLDTTNGEVIEAFFNILHQNTARAFETAKKKGVSIIAKVPLDSGWLSGKYNSESTFTDIRSRWSKKDIKTRAALVDRIRDIISKEINLAYAAISFCLAYDAVSTVIPGNTSVEQLENNLESIKNPISKKLVLELEKFYQNEVKELNLPW